MITIHEYDTPSVKTWHLAIKGIRYSWGSNDRSDSEYDGYDGGFFTIGDQDKALMLKLIKTGNDHSKFMRQLPVIVDITAPEYWWKETDTYKISTVRNSSSMMHTLGSKPFDAGMFSWEDLSTEIIAQRNIIDQLNWLRDRWIDEGGKHKGPHATYWRAMIQAIPQSWNYHCIWSANYQVIRNMYHARKNHRLSEWREFCKWIEGLPYGDLITTV